MSIRSSCWIGSIAGMAGPAFDAAEAAAKAGYAFGVRAEDTKKIAVNKTGKISLRIAI